MTWQHSERRGLFTLTNDRSSDNMLDIVALGSSYSWGCSKGRPALLISQEARVQNM